MVLGPPTFLDLNRSSPILKTPVTGRRGREIVLYEVTSSSAYYT